MKAKTPDVASLSFIVSAGSGRLWRGSREGHAIFISETKRKWWLLASSSCVLGLVLLDETVVGVALPTIQKSLSLSGNQSHWVVNVYLLTFACLIAVGGKLGDLYGTLRVFLLGLAIFGLSSAACGLAPSGDLLVLARGVQGIGAAIVFPLYMAMITMTFAKEIRGLALAISGAIGTSFLALGPLVGGLITEYLSWRWIFGINPFLVVAVGIIVSLTWRDVKRPKGGGIDWIGLVLIASGIFCTVFALMESDTFGWQSPLIWGGLFAGAGLLVLFYWAETVIDPPLIEVKLFSSSVFSGSALTIFMAQYAKMPLFVFVALYAQTDLKLSPAMAGLLVMLAPVLQPFTAAVCGRLADTLPKRQLVLVSLAILTGSFVWLTATVSIQNVYVFAPGLLAAGLALPVMFIPTRAAIAEALPEHKHGQGGGIAMTSQIIGGTVGLAASSAAFTLGGYALVFAVTAFLLLLVFGYAWFAFQEGGARVRAH